MHDLVGSHFSGGADCKRDLNRTGMVGNFRRATADLRGQHAAIGLGRYSLGSRFVGAGSGSGRRGYGRRGRCWRRRRRIRSRSRLRRSGGGRFPFFGVCQAGAKTSDKRQTGESHLLLHFYQRSPVERSGPRSLDRFSEPSRPVSQCEGAEAAGAVEVVAPSFAAAFLASTRFTSSSAFLAGIKSGLICSAVSISDRARSKSFLPR